MSLLAPLDCGSPNASLNGNVQFSDTTLASVATYSCQPGYTSTSLMSRTCTNTSQWSDAVSVCISGRYHVSCYHLVFIADIPVLLRHLKAAVTGQHELLWRQ